ncbi:MAG: alpha-1-antitrypsin, partial [Verrucomicrobia bacterium]|nr:alpha-1-antitrypsin [Verrucomicrobiota bacterium]
MSLLAPLFLIGAAAIALPILFHLIRRTIREKQVFSSLMFLQPTPPRVTRQNRLENLLLLLARCAVIALLALAFARPFLANPVATGSPETQTRRLYIL